MSIGKTAVSGVPGTPPGVNGVRGPFASLHIRNFRLLLTGTVMTNATQWIQQVTMSWLVFDMTGSGTMLGTVSLVRSLASLGPIPVAGLLIDRVSRRALMLMVNGWLFLLSLALGLLLVTGKGNLSYIFLFSLLGGLAACIDVPLRQVVLFNLVPRSLAPNAVAFVQTGWSLMRSFGPGLGGFLILWIGAGGNFLLQAAAYVLVALNILLIRFPPRQTGVVHHSAMQNIREGLRYVTREPMTRTFMLMGMILPLFIIPIFTVLPPVYAREVFQGGPEVLGFLLSAVGVGGIIGGIFVASLRRLERRGVLQLGALLFLSFALIGFAFSTELWLALLLSVVAGFFEIIFLTTNQTLLQLSIPDEIRGRVTAVVNLNFALSPLGGLIAGAGSDLFGGPKWITVIMCGFAAAIAVAVFLGSATVRNYRISQTIAADPTKPRA